MEKKGGTEREGSIEETGKGGRAGNQSSPPGRPPPPLPPLPPTSTGYVCPTAL